MPVTPGTHTIARFLGEFVPLLFGVEPDVLFVARHGDEEDRFIGLDDGPCVYFGLDFFPHVGRDLEAFFLVDRVFVGIEKNHS